MTPNKAGTKLNTDISRTPSIKLVNSDMNKHEPNNQLIKITLLIPWIVSACKVVNSKLMNLLD